MARREKAELREIAMAPLILFTSGYYHQTLLQTRFRDAGLTPNVLFSSNQLLTIKSFVRQNLAGAFLLPQVIEPGENIIALPVDPPLPLNIAVVWRRDVFLTREIRQFIHFMRPALSDLIMSGHRRLEHCNIGAFSQKGTQNQVPKSIEN